MILFNESSFLEFDDRITHITHTHIAHIPYCPGNVFREKKKIQRPVNDWNGSVGDKILNSTGDTKNVFMILAATILQLASYYCCGVPREAVERGAGANSACHARTCNIHVKLQQWEL